MNNKSSSENVTNKPTVRKFAAKPYTKKAFRIASKQEQNQTSETLRLVLREIPHSVVVVTAARESVSSPWLKNGRPHVDFCGATISSMTSVTLGPPAIISFNLKTPSTTLDSILKNKEFRVHMLTANRDGAEVANSFIKHKHEQAFDHLRESGRLIGTGAGYQEVPPPTIHGPGIRGYLLCTVLEDKCIQVGDHMVVIARIDGVRPRGYEKLPDSMGCLMYSDQKYKKHGDALIFHDRASPLRAVSSDGALAAIRFIGDNESDLVQRLTMLLNKDEVESSVEENLSLEEDDLREEADDALNTVMRYINIEKTDLIRKVDYNLKARAAEREEDGVSRKFSTLDPGNNRSLEEKVVNKLVELIERSPEQWANRATAIREPEEKQEEGDKPWWHI